MRILINRVSLGHDPVNFKLTSTPVVVTREVPREGLVGQRSVTRLRNSCFRRHASCAESMKLVAVNLSRSFVIQELGKGCQSVRMRYDPG